MVEKKSVSFNEEVFKMVESRRDFMLTRSEILNRDLSRYYYLTFVSQLDIFEKLTTNELYAIFATCNGAMYSSNISDGRLRFAVEESYQYGVLSGIEGLNDIKPLLEKMADWSLMDQYAAIDLAERFWKEGTREIDPINTPEELKEMLLKEYQEVIRHV